jgi:hypothetical protein
VTLNPLGTSANSCPRVPAPGDDDDDDGDDEDECGAVCGMKIGRGDRITWRKRTTETHDQTWDRNNCPVS